MKIKDDDTGVAQDCVHTCPNCLYVEHTHWYIILFEPLWPIKLKGSGGMFQKTVETRV